MNKHLLNIKRRRLIDVFDDSQSSEDEKAINNLIEKSSTSTKMHQTKKNSTVNEAGIPVHNSFASLENIDFDIDDDDLNTATGSRTNTKTNKADKVPPIVTGANNYDKIKVILSNIKITNYQLKFMSIGLKINLNALSDYNQFIEAIDKDAIKYYTHAIPNMKPIKIVLKGLFTITVDELKSHLSNVNVTPEDIKIMKLKNTRYTGQANYLLYFKKSSISINDLKKIRAVNNIIVSWEYYKHTSRPTQCNNCQLYGHGGSNCKLSPVCIKCSGGHKSSDCDIENPSEPKNASKIKCANCLQKHTANFIGCPSRADYLTLKSGLSGKNGKLPKRGAKAVNMDPHSISTNGNANFPALKPTRNQSNFFDKFSSRITNTPQNQSNSFNNTNQTNNYQNDLLSPQELLNIFKEIITKMKHCKSRFEQLELIADLAMRYMVCHDG